MTFCCFEGNDRRGRPRRPEAGRVELQGKVGVVTGSSRGIGRAVALRLGQLGASVCVNFRSDREGAEQTLSELAEGFIHQADVGDPEQATGLIEASYERFGRLDFLVNNAAIISRSSVDEITPDEARRLLAVNLEGVIFTCQAAARRMGPGSSIVNFSSSVTRMLLAGYALYAASKGAVEQFSRVLAKELGPRQIRVNVLSPGPTDTEMFRQGKDENQIAALAQMAALERLGQPQDLAEVAAFLVTPRAGWITGQIIGANGGFAP